MRYPQGRAGNILKSPGGREESTTTKGIDKLRHAAVAASTPDIMDGLGNEFTAEVIAIVNDNGMSSSPANPSFRGRAQHNPSLGRVAIRVRPLDYPTHIVLPEIPQAGGKEKKGYFNIWEQNLPVAHAVSSELPAPPIGSTVRVTVDGIGESRTYWYKAVLDDKPSAPFIEPTKNPMDAFKPCPPNFHCKPAQGDPINTEGTSWGYSAATGSPQSGLLLKAIVNCSKYNAFQLPKGRGVIVESFTSAEDTNYTDLGTPKSLRKRLQKHGFTYIIFGVAFYGSSVTSGPASKDFLEPYIKELVRWRIRPFLMGELFGGAASDKSQQMVDDLVNLANDTGASGIITRMRSLSPSNPGWTTESAEAHAGHLLDASIKNNVSIGLLGPGHPAQFPELEQPILKVKESVNYVMANIAPQPSLTTPDIISMVFDGASEQWAELGYEAIFPVFPAYGPGFSKVPGSQGSVGEGKTNMAPGQSMPPEYFKMFYDTIAKNSNTPIGIMDWANLDQGMPNDFGNYNWSTNRWDVIKEIPITDVYPKTEAEARERRLPAYLSTDGPLVYLPPIKPLNSPTGFTRPAAILTGSLVEFGGPKPPPKETYNNEPDGLKPAEEADNQGTAPADGETGANGIPLDGHDPSAVGAELESTTSCPNALVDPSKYLFPAIRNRNKLGRFAMPGAERGTIEPQGGSGYTAATAGKPGPFSRYSSTGYPPIPTKWPTKNGEAPGANAYGERHYWSGNPGLSRGSDGEELGKDGRWGGLSAWTKRNILYHRGVEKRFARNLAKKKSDFAASSENSTSDAENSQSRYANPLEMYGGCYVGAANANFIHEFRVIFEIACRVSGYTPGDLISETDPEGDPRRIAAFVPKGKMQGSFFPLRYLYSQYNSIKHGIEGDPNTQYMTLEEYGMSEKKSKALGLNQANTIGEFKNKFESARWRYVQEHYSEEGGRKIPKRWGFAFSMHATGCAFDLCPGENWLGGSSAKALHNKFVSPAIWDLTGGYMTKAKYYYHEKSKYHNKYKTKSDFAKASGAGTNIRTGGDNIFRIFHGDQGPGLVGSYSLEQKSKAKNLVKQLLEGAEGAPTYKEFTNNGVGINPENPYSENLVQQLNEWSMSSGLGYVFFSSSPSPNANIWVVKRSVPLSGVRMHPAFWQTFIRAGWSWGGAWSGPFKDDHHFSRKILFDHQRRAIAGKGARPEFPFYNDSACANYEPVPIMDLKDSNKTINPSKTLLPIKDGTAYHPSWDETFDSEYIYIHGIGNFPRDPSSPLMSSAKARSDKSSNPLDPANYPDVDFT
jgi:hypothetical protein